ncbi:MAG TPA: prepilin peptidase [Caulobacteraceae bacterium]|jgi:prepilin peptidase CpaA
MTTTEIVRWAVAGLLTAVLIWAAATDVRVRKIPNWTVLAVLGLFVVWALVHPLNWDLWALAAGVIGFAVTFGLYSAGLLGAGDSKMFAAVALFAGLGHLALLALATALVGGVIAAVSLVARPTRALVMLRLKGKGDFGRGVPYGVAIAAGAILVVWISVLDLHGPGVSGIF